MLRCGKHGWNIKRANDKLPKAMLWPFPDGNSTGYVLGVGAVLLADLWG